MDLFWANFLRIWSWDIHLVVEVLVCREPPSLIPETTRLMHSGKKGYQSWESGTRHWAIVFCYSFSGKRVNSQKTSRFFRFKFCFVLFCLIKDHLSELSFKMNFKPERLPPWEELLEKWILFGIMSSGEWKSSHQNGRVSPARNAGSGTSGSTLPQLVNISPIPVSTDTPRDSGRSSPDSPVTPHNVSIHNQSIWYGRGHGTMFFIAMN